MIKNAKQYTEQLDKIASEVEGQNPVLALWIDKLSDVLDGKKSASTLKFDPDEARYMAGRFNFNVRNREADEPFMDSFNQSNFEQVIGVRRNPTPVKLAYQRVK